MTPDPAPPVYRFTRLSSLSNVLRVGYDPGRREWVGFVGRSAEDGGRAFVARSVVELLCGLASEVTEGRYAFDATIRPEDLGLLRNAPEASPR